MIGLVGTSSWVRSIFLCPHWTSPAITLSNGTPSQIEPAKSSNEYCYVEYKIIFYQLSLSLLVHDVFIIHA